MAHQIYVSQTGRASMAYIGQKPWHELGQELTRDTGLVSVDGKPIMISDTCIERWSKEAGLDFEVAILDVLYQFAGETKIADNKKLFARTDTGAIVGQGSDRFKPVQPIEALRFFGGIAYEYGYYLETAGVLKGGSVVWAMAKRDEQIAIKGTDDKLNTRILFSTSFDGSSPTLGQHVCERVVCANTLRVALGENKKSRVSVRHSTTFSADDMRRQLGVAEAIPDLWHAFEQDVNTMHEHRVKKQSQVLAFASKVLDIDPSEVMQKWLDDYKPLHEIVAATTQARGAEQSVWGLVNGVTAYADHMAGRTADTRLTNAWFGRTGLLKDKAYSLAKRVIQGDTEVLELEGVVEESTSQVAESIVQSAANDFAAIMQKGYKSKAEPVQIAA